MTFDQNGNHVPNHMIVRNNFLDMQKEKGAAIRPLGLFELFLKILNKFYLPNGKMNRVRARNITDVFCALQNEYFIINYDGRNSNWFYMTEKRWAKYGLGKKAIHNSRVFLQDIEAIETKVEQHPHKPQNKVRFYKINLEMLENLKNAVRESNPRSWH